MADIGSLIAHLGMDTTRFKAGIAESQKGLKRFQRVAKRQLKVIRRGFNDVAKSVVTVGSQIFALVGGAFLALGAASAKAIDDQVKFAEVIGTTQGELAGLQLAAQELSGVADTGLNMALQRMTRRVAEAAQGLGEGKQAIKDLGLDAKVLAEQDPAETFRQIGDAIQKIPDQSERLRLAFKLFDSEGARLVTTLQAGSEEILKYQDKARALGLVLSDTQANSIEEMNDSLGRARLAMRGLGNIIAVTLAPVITGIANDYEQAAIKADKFSQVQGFFDGLITVMGHVGDTVNTVLIGYSKLWVLAAKIARGPQGGVFDWLTDDSITAAYQKQLDDALAWQAALESATTPSERLKTSWENYFNEVKGQFVQSNVDLTNEITAFGATQRDIFSDLGDAITRDFDNVMDGVFGVFKNTLAKMASEALASNFRGIFGSIFDGGGGSKKTSSGNNLTSILGPSFAALAGFANGGQFNVGGSGGTDSQVVAFRASPNETVTVSTPGQMAAGGGGVTIVNHNNFAGVNGVDRGMLAQALEQNKQKTMFDIQNLMGRNRF